MCNSDKKKSACNGCSRRRRIFLKAYYSSSQLKAPKKQKNNNISRRFLIKSAAFRRKTPRRPPETLGIALNALRNMQGKRAAVLRSPSLSHSISNITAVVSPSQRRLSCRRVPHWWGLFAACRRSLACVPRSPNSKIPMP